MLDLLTPRPASGVACILIGCSARKTKLASPTLRASTLEALPQVEIEARWRSRLSSAAGDLLVPARDLYDGSSFRRARALADDLRSRLAVISAGLGLVSGSTPVPPYDLTLDRGSPEAVSARVADGFRPEAWWIAVNQGAFAVTPEDAVGNGGRILVGLTRPYARLVGDALTTWPMPLQDRLRLFGEGLERSLPAALHSRIVRYGRRLDVISRGTRLDAPVRAMEHFAHIACNLPLASVDEDQVLVDASLAGVAEPQAPSRRRLDDPALLEVIRGLRRERSNARDALRDLRTRHGIACERDRFQRLFLQAAI